MVGRTRPTPHESNTSKVARLYTTLWSDQICDPINHWVPPSLSPKLGFLLTLTPSLIKCWMVGQTGPTSHGSTTYWVAHGFSIGSTDQIGQWVAHLGPGINANKNGLLSSTSGPAKVTQYSGFFSSIHFPSISSLTISNPHISSDNQTRP